MASSYTLGAHFESFVRQLVDSGRYASASEVMRDGLRLLEERESQRQAKLDGLRAAIREGVESGASIEADDLFIGLRTNIAVEAGSDARHFRSRGGTGYRGDR